MFGMVYFGSTLVRFKDHKARQDHKDLMDRQAQPAKLVPLTKLVPLAKLVQKATQEQLVLLVQKAALGRKEHRVLLALVEKQV